MAKVYDHADECKELKAHFLMNASQSEVPAQSSYEFAQRADSSRRRLLAETISQGCLLVQSVVIAYIGYGHLCQPEGNLRQLGFTFKPRWHESQERALLLRHFTAVCQVLGAAHIGRGVAGMLAGVCGGLAVLCLLAGEIVFLGW